MEMRHKFVNHARNVFDRAVTVLPRVPELWLKFAFMEEMMSNVDLARLVFARWIQWMPDMSAYVAFVRFELRHGNLAHARGVYEQMVSAHPSARAYLKYAAFEETKAKNIPASRAVYERAAAAPSGTSVDADLYIAFAHFEERCKEPERARAIYKYAVSHLPVEATTSVYDALTVFEKQLGERDSLESVILSKKRVEYEERLTADPRDYDVWLDLIRLEQGERDAARVREVYERAVSQTPPPGEKRFWRRYIYLWIGYAVWEELDMSDLDRAAGVYRAALAAIPHGHRRFSFAKLWVLAAKLELRRHNLGGARLLLGNALGVLPHKDSIYRDYIALELSLAEIDRARMLYRKWLERNPTACVAFIEFADMEAGLGELRRARDIFEVGVASAEIDEPETLWKAYIDCEVTYGEMSKVVDLYERLLVRLSHVLVWIAYAKYFEKSPSAREIFIRADRALKDRMVEQSQDREAAAADRVRLLDTWLSWEQALGDGSGHVSHVRNLMPKRIKRRRAVTDARGIDAGWEEYYEYVFPEEQAVKPQLKILEAARKWKLAREKQVLEQQGLQAQENRQELEKA
jgi:crooked neck